ncbi:hypothetical protein [Desertibacillus haloalkaliphilus]|uniref:hypothetical protein n=1 Tax=Desertibacillus haloalkaliphilus TaxID=1328930 RepID=UPI001C28132E|nr:hypothetical protein [Desertibacillus haloalkaliphilus]MBU8906671.1 hypothetical protein [Desertibacillus haloalkaliphilus]
MMVYTNFSDRNYDSKSTTDKIDHVKKRKSMEEIVKLLQDQGVNATVCKRVKLTYA